MDLAQKLNSYPKEYWNFSTYRKDSPLVKYPAIMVAPMQECIIREVISSDPSIKNVFDPFSGSGTVLIEGKKLGLDVLGFDINPLAILISRVQLEGIPSDIAYVSISRLFSRITMLNGNVQPFYFNNIHKWFNKDVIQSLSVIRKAIIDEPNDAMRRFFWCCFSETVKKFSNTRTSTFKLHLKEKKQIQDMVDESIDFFKEHTITQARKYLTTSSISTKINLKCGDAINLIDTIEPSSIDLICTSPPYGDNKTTVTYGQYSILPIMWISSKDLEIWSEEIVSSFSAIDSLSLGGRLSSINENDYADFVAGISPAKKKKVIAFFRDYELIFSKLARVLKPGKLMILTLGNRRVDNHEVRFDQFNDALATKYGMELDSTITRKIIGKRMPSKVSNIENVGAVSSISTEYIKVYRRMIK
jgi:site-specific DNA-methyltransferase (cytosine-N4-specific)